MKIIISAIILILCVWGYTFFLNILPSNYDVALIFTAAVVGALSGLYCLKSIIEYLN